MIHDIAPEIVDFRHSVRKRADVPAGEKLKAEARRRRHMVNSMIQMIQMIQMIPMPSEPLHLPICPICDCPFRPRTILIRLRHGRASDPCP